MDDPSIDKIVGLLEEIRDGQKLQLERQTEALARQSEAVARQQERFARLDAGIGGASEAGQFAGRLQESARLIKRAGLIMLIYVPVSLIVLVLVCWLAFHRAAP